MDSKNNSSKIKETNQSSDLVRVSKLMSERGLCSRREADVYIQDGLVFVDGKQVTELGTKVSPKSKIELRKLHNDSVTILLNKPLGYVSSQPEDDHEPAIRLIKPETQDTQFNQKNLSPKNFKKLAVAGRLDVNSTGLLVFTQDGRIAKLLLSGDVEKEYLVRVRGSLPEEKLKLLNHGLSLDEKPLKPAKVEWINEDQLRFVLKEGKKRQIRRMCELVDLEVMALKRVRIGKVVLGKLKEGCWRFLEPHESF